MDSVEEYNSYVRSLDEFCNKQDDSDSCYELGKYFAMLRRSSKTLHLAKKYFILGCEKNHGKSCSLASGMLENESNPEESQKYWSEAQRLLTHECEIENSPKACMFWGMHLLQYSKDPVIDYPVALRLLEKCCKLGQSICCVNAGTIVKNYIKDSTKSIELFEKACSLDNGDACWLLGEEIEKVAAASESTGDKSHIQYYKKACDLGCLEGCLAYGTEMIKEENFEEALESLTRTCDKNEPNGCLLGGLLLLSTQNYTHASQLFDKGCNVGNDECCSWSAHAKDQATKQ